MSTKPILQSSYRTKVFVGLSGGVDSAVSAALLKEQGFDVTGVFIKAWQPDWLPCSWREERRDAMKVAIHLDIPFLFLDLEKEYKKGVVDKMLAEYKAGRTPNPDVLCNKEIKFGHFWHFAQEHGADFIATGHYARNVNKNLREGVDRDKDQSYFLWNLTEQDLNHVLFPVGRLEKSSVRDLARKFKLPVGDKKDSQGICFMGDVSMEEFLSHFIQSKAGKVLNTKGEVIGTHSGLIHYTIGERRGFEVKVKSATSGPFYVVAKDAKKNTLTVSDQESEIISLSPTKLALKEVNLSISSPDMGLTARIRYRGEKLSVSLNKVGNPSRLARASRREAGQWVAEFREPVRGLSLGQSIVFYDGSTCLGGAVMDKVLA